ncbi:hypothetical protein QBC36DRAFT_326523 [Triangularia setosa]|uniref:ML-like domain-containing protein n=1 Tax=Triangularia setosa TaxID=2587417 RepID=A0AAN7A9R8_9PEZI|nr:hypothetical protein QBC36DRAFT_326523 [Podospora setosa]
MREVDASDFPVILTPLLHLESPSERCGVQARGYHDQRRHSADVLPISWFAAMTGRSPSPDALSSDLAGNKTHRARHTASRSRPSEPRPICLPAVLMLLLGPFSRPAAAASVPFENCISDIHRNSNPPKLQWEPKHIQASFEATDRHTLRVTLWGNVTGSYTAVPLPPASSPDWAEANKTDGKLLELPDKDVPQPKYTTLRSKINVLTYEPWFEQTNFCNQSLNNAKCPLGPVFGYWNESDFGLVKDKLPFVTISNDFYSSYAFGSFSTFFEILYGDHGDRITCVKATVTPDLGGLAWMLKFLPLAVLVFVGAATIFAAIFSPWGTSDVFHWSSNYGRDPDLLRLVTPGFGDCLQYIQFVVLTGGLTLNYPGFYQPIVSQAAWSALMFNQSFVTKDPGWVSIQDGIYVTDGTYGLQRLAQLAGMANPEDIWASTIIWVLVIIAAMTVLVQAGFVAQWLYRFFQKVSEEDLRAKNIPFTLGNVVRIVLNYFLMPIVALSTFQLVIAGESPVYTVVLAVLALILIVGFAAWLLFLVAKTKPRAFLFDDLSTLLLYGPLYNTYSDEAAAFTMIPVLLTIVRGIAVGAVQPAGVAQVVILAICEVIQILTLHAFRPFHSATSMNAYHTLFSALRLVTVLLMVVFVPSLGVEEGQKGWIGYAILITHAGVLVLGFLLNAVQTVVEVVARMLGAGGDDIQGQSRGGLSKIFGMRQLSRRMSRRETGPSRQSQLSSSAMLDVDEASKPGYIMPGGRVRSESAGSMGVMMHHRHRSSSGLDTPSFDGPARPLESIAGSYTPTTPGEASNFSFLPSPGHPGRPQGSMTMQAPDPYYRPPRQRRPTIETTYSPTAKVAGSWTSSDWAQKRLSEPGTVQLSDPVEIGTQISRDATPAPYVVPFAHSRTDYSMREADFYYGVRGQRLNSDAPSRKLRTGPADPTRPMASAAGWFRNIFGPKGKDKGKGFEVVRSSRMPPAMQALNGGFEDDRAPQGIPVAMGVLRNGPIDSDDDDGTQSRKDATRSTQGAAPEQEPLNGQGSPQDDDIDGLGITTVPEASPSPPDANVGITSRSPTTVPRPGPHGPLHIEVPNVPRRSSKRNSNPQVQMPQLSLPVDAGRSSNLTPSGTTSSRLPFERTPSQKRMSGSSAGLTEDFSQVELNGQTGSSEERPAGYGFVAQGSINRVDREIDLLGTSAEVIDERR